MADALSIDHLLLEKEEETHSASVLKSMSITKTTLSEWPGLEPFQNYLNTTHELELTWSLKIEQFKFRNQSISGNLLAFRVKDSAVPRMLHTFGLAEEARIVDGYNRLFKQKGIYFLRFWVTRDVETLFILPQHNTNNFYIIMLTTTVFLLTATVSEYFDVTIKFHIRNVGEFLDFVTTHVTREHPVDFSGLNRESTDLSPVIKMLETHPFHGSLHSVKMTQSMRGLPPQAP